MTFLYPRVRVGRAAAVSGVLALGTLGTGACSSDEGGAVASPGCQVLCKTVECLFTELSGEACTGDCAQAKSQCVSACGEGTANEPPECRTALDALGACGSALTCDDLSGGSCGAEFSDVSRDCPSIDGGGLGTGGGGNGGAPGGGAGGGGGSGGVSAACVPFGFVTSGDPCTSGSCDAVDCECPGSITRSVVRCTSDGCLVGADCDEVCGSFEQALSCVQELGTPPAGSGGAGGTGGSAGVGGSPECVPNTCEDYGATCGTLDDGCGTQITCGTCVPPESCGGGGLANTCGCEPASCSALGYECGETDDGCGGMVDCGTCSGSEWCGGGGTDHLCGCTSGAGSVGPIGAGLGADVSTTNGGLWNSVESVTASDDVSASQRLGSIVETNYLVASDFDLNVPASATIVGIEMHVERRSRDGNIADLAVRIVKGGNIGTTDFSQVGDWGISEQTVTYGGPTELWGETWTAADINDPSFGLAFSATHTAIAGNDDVFVDYVGATVHYTVTCN